MTSVTDPMTKLSDRQTGRTTQQMKAAEQNALYVWPNSNLYYPKELARHIGRPDLRIVSLSSLYDHRHFGERILIVIDHEAESQAMFGSWSDADVVLSIGYVNSCMAYRRKAAK